MKEMKKIPGMVGPKWDGSSGKTKTVEQAGAGSRVRLEILLSSPQRLHRACLLETVTSNARGWP